ncbi:hypothetical protein [Streptomyces sp. NPDC049906]|uniref:hypothetical protein n=1 Tax=Streptomyces sp. NPDC049906 TaxID=3155656 RepID=UPI00342EEE2F
MTSQQLQKPAHGYDESSIGHQVHSVLERLRRLEDSWDPETISLLSDCEIRPNWRSLELGAGAGSIAYWLAGTSPEGAHHRRRPGHPLPRPERLPPPRDQ